MARPRRWVSRCTSRSRRRRRRSVSPRVSPRTPSFPTAPSISPHPRSRCAGDNAPGGRGERCRPPWSRRWRRRGAAPALARRRMRRLSACDYRAPSAAAAAGAIGETRCALSARGGEKEGRGGGSRRVGQPAPARSCLAPLSSTRLVRRRALRRARCGSWRWRTLVRGRRRHSLSCAPHKGKSGLRLSRGVIGGGLAGHLLPWGRWVFLLVGATRSRTCPRRRPSCASASPHTARAVASSPSATRQSGAVRPPLPLPLPRPPWAA